MGQDTFPLGPFVGMNNRLPPDKLRRPPQDGGGQFVSSAVNIDFTGANTMRRRPGAALALGGGDYHSFWTDGEAGFAVDSDTLYRIASSASGLVREAIAAVTPGLQFSYAKTPRDIYASNGVQRLRIGASGPAEEWGVPTPTVAPLLTGEAGGSLPPGRYQVVISFTDAAGEEGGTSIPQVVDVPENGRVIVSDIEQRPGFTTTVYMTACNGDTFYRVGDAALSWLVIPVLNAQGYRPIGLLHAQTPAGHIVRYLNGRLFVASGDTLFYSEPHHLGLYNPARNYIQFPEPITMVEPCQNGLYLSADQTYWIDGEVSQADLNPVLPYRAVLGTSAQIPNANQVWWMSERGAVVGEQSGQVKNVQEGAVAVQPAAAGASLFREQDGMKQMISTLFGPQSSVMAARSFMDAEIIRKETIL